MTLPPMRRGARVAGNAAHRPGPGARDIVTRLRGAAARMVPFSPTRALLREAASTIERLDGDARRHATEVAHVAAELAQDRSASHGV